MKNILTKQILQSAKITILAYLLCFNANAYGNLYDFNHTINSNEFAYKINNSLTNADDSYLVSLFKKIKSMIFSSDNVQKEKEINNEHLPSDSPYESESSKDKLDKTKSSEDDISINEMQNHAQYASDMNNTLTDIEEQNKQVGAKDESLENINQLEAMNADDKKMDKVNPALKNMQGISNKDVIEDFPPEDIDDILSKFDGLEEKFDNNLSDNSLALANVNDVNNVTAKNNEDALPIEAQESEANINNKQADEPIITKAEPSENIDNMAKIVDEAKVNNTKNNQEKELAVDASSSASDSKLNDQLMNKQSEEATNATSESSENIDHMAKIVDETIVNFKENGTEEKLEKDIDNVQKSSALKDSEVVIDKRVQKIKSKISADFEKQIEKLSNSKAASETVESDIQSDIQNEPEDMYFYTNDEPKNLESESDSEGLPDKRQIRFIRDEAIVFTLKDDDVVLGQLTENALIKDLDYPDYIQLFWDKFKKIANQGKVDAIDNFIENYEDFDPQTQISKAELETKFVQAVVYIKQDNFESLKILLDYYPLINYQNEKGNNLLHYAAIWKKFNSAKLLIYRGINIHARNNVQLSALDIARKQTDPDMEILLMRALKPAPVN